MRMFFALWPDVHVAGQLAELARMVQGTHGGRVVAPQSLHLTLAYVGATPPDRVADLTGVGDAVRARPFELDLVRLRWRSRQAMLWAEVDAIPEALNALKDDLDRALSARGFAVEQRRFAAHITLIRKIFQQPELPARITLPQWRVGAFVLAESRLEPSGAQYRFHTRWPCAAA